MMEHYLGFIVRARRDVSFVARDFIPANHMHLGLVMVLEAAETGLKLLEMTEFPIFYTFFAFFVIFGALFLYMK